LSVWIVGVGPGDPEYLSLRGKRLIEEADVVAGFKTALAVVEKWIKGQIIPIDYRNQEGSLEEVGVAASQGKNCVICNYGDPNFSDKEYIERVRRACGPVEIVPGISSVQIACAKAGVAMESALFITFHKRAPIDDDKEELAETVAKGKRTVVLLPHTWDFMPQDIAKFLMERGIPGDIPAIIYQKLTLPDESDSKYPLSDLAELETQFSDLSIMIIPRP